MNLLLDTNIVLDHLLDRKLFSHAASRIFADIEEGMHNGFLCATTITTIDYLTKKVLGTKQAKSVITNLLEIFEVAPVNRIVLESAIKSKFPDFEDAVLHEAAIHQNLDAIITRNLVDFKKAKLPVYSSEQFIVL